MTWTQVFGSAFLITWLGASLRLAGPILLAALGETFAERAGILNVGIEGTILVGALASYLVCHATGLVWPAFAAGALAGLVSNLLLAWMYVVVRANQVVVGIVFNLLALGLANFVYSLALGKAASPQMIPMFPPLQIPLLSDLPFLGPVLFRGTAPLYLTFALVPVAHLALFRTGFGLALRSVGESPRAADAAGIDVARMRVIGTLISGTAAGAAGANLMLAEIGLFRETIVTGQGFIALAIVILGRWSPWKAAGAALLFGAADALQLSLQVIGTGLPPQILLSLPYVVTILAISGLFGRSAVQPAALMQPYAKL